MTPNHSKAMLLAFVLSLLSCSSSSNQSQDTNASELAAARLEIEANVKKVLADMPPPSEVPYLIMSTGAPFDLNAVNPLNGIPRYILSEGKSALNLGIYATDIAYLVSYDRPDLALEYMNESQKLASAIRVDEVIDLAMVAQFEENMDNKDSLTALIDNILQTSGDRLNELEELESSALLLVGSWLEGMFLSCEIIRNYPNELSEEEQRMVLEPIIKILIDQKVSLETLIKTLDEVPNSENAQEMKSALHVLLNVYEEGLSKDELKGSGGKGEGLHHENAISQLSKEVTKIRQSIVQ